jgi:putative membrane protein
MNSALAIAGTVLVGVAAVVHVLIFVMESVTWSTPATWRRFGLRSQHDADVVRPMALNQGFYNLFLAAGTVIGLCLLATEDCRQAGFALVLFTAASMVLAAVVLLFSAPKLYRAALIQGTAPLIGIVLLVLAAAVG